MCFYLFVFFFATVSATSNASFEPIVIIMSFSTNSSISFFIAVEESISILACKPASLNFTASSTVDTARKSIPLSIKNFEYGINPNP